MKRIISLICAFFLTFTLLSFPSFAENGEENQNNGQSITAPVINSGAAVVMDADTGVILYQKNMMEKLSPADTAQLMTVLLGIESGKADTVVTVSQEVIDTVDREGTHISLVPGEQVLLKDLFYASVLASASDAAKTIAAAVSGSEKTFAESMTKRMKDLGAVNTSFTNADGSYEENNFTTAQDMALLTKEAMKNKTFREIFGKTSYTMAETNKNASGRSFTTLCLLMKNSSMEVKYEGTIGGKTGWNKKAGYTLVSAAENDGRSLICVILNSETSQQRYDETIALFDYVFSTYRNVEVPDSLLTPTEIPVMKNGTIVRKITVSIPKGTLLSTSTAFREGTMTVSSLPSHILEGDTNLKLTVSAKDNENNTVVLGTIILDVKTTDMSLQEAPGGEKIVPPTLGARIWKVLRTILWILLGIIGILIFMAGGLFLMSYIQRRNRKARRRRLKEEKQNKEQEEDVKNELYTGRRHRKLENNEK